MSDSVDDLNRKLHQFALHLSLPASFGQQIETLRTLTLGLVGAMETLTGGTAGWESQASTACQAAWTPLVSPLFAVVNALDHFHEQMTALIAQVEQIHENSTAYAEQHGIDIPLIEMEWNGKLYLGRTVEDRHQQIAAVGTGAPATGTSSSPSGATAGTSETPVKMEGGGEGGGIIGAIFMALVWALERAQEHHENEETRNGSREDSDCVGVYYLGRPGSLCTDTRHRR